MIFPSNDTLKSIVDIPSDWAVHVVVRGDLDSLNPGKIAAQVHHAGTQFIKRMTSPTTTGDFSQLIMKEFHDWWNAADGFGTTLVFQAIAGNKTVALLRGLVTQAREVGLPAGEIIDPSYPIQDGSAMHIVTDVLTCAWFFAPRSFDRVITYDLTIPDGNDVRLFVGDFRSATNIKLHP